MVLYCATYTGYTNALLRSIQNVSAKSEGAYTVL